jgi:chromosome segregation ATPase
MAHPHTNSSRQTVSYTSPELPAAICFPPAQCVGRVISTKREALLSLCDYLNIEIDNPLSILMQETAKKFLADSTPHDKYQFFLKGTSLESISSDYALIRQYIDICVTTVKEKQKSLPDIKEDFEALQQRWDVTTLSLLACLALRGSPPSCQA